MWRNRSWGRGNSSNMVCGSMGFMGCLPILLTRILNENDVLLRVCYVYCKISDVKVKSMTDYFYGLNNAEYFVSDRCY